jgi:RHS repeat-associated protein
VRPVRLSLRAMATGLAAVVTAGVLTGVSAPQASAASWDPYRPAATKSVPGKVSVPSALPTAATAAAAPTVDRPAAGSAIVTLPAGGTAIKAGTLPVRVAGSGGGAVRVDLLDRPVAERAGVSGMLLRVAPASGTATGRLTMDVDYAGIAAAYGGDHGNRLRLVRLPACAATTPAVPACLTGRPVPARTDTKTRTLTATVDTGPGLLAVTAAAGGSSGDYSATPLSSSASWQVSAQTGDFGWSYPMRVPPPPGGAAPQVALSYSSGSVDGRVVATNNQPSWVGEGFDFGPGYVERKYASCTDDGVATKPGDLCWKHDNATLMLNGQATELILDETTQKWRPKDDNGARIEKLVSATIANGDDDGEHWRVTTVDGTRYTFGLNRLPGWATGKPETNSTLSVPVFGNNAGEKCATGTFATSWCQQAWRWNLDHVVDPRGNATTYWYTREANNYGRNLTTTATPYHRAGYLTEIKYGLRSDALFGTAPDKVVFGVSERCVATSTFTCAENLLTTGNAARWPDVPFDQNCATGASCAGKHSPTFWSRKRLTSVTTQVWRGTDYDDVDSWTLRQSFPPPATGDGTASALWLEGITHTGAVGPTTAALPEVTFTSVSMPNRVDAAEGIPPLVKRRIASVAGESGGVLSVNYTGPDCVAGATPAPDSNTRRCFPTYWSPEGATDPQLGWFHKYLVTSVVADSRQAADTDETTTYEYVGGAAWHWNDDPLTLPAHRTWSQFRGYGKVLVTEGAANETQGRTEYLYLRGMHGDRTAAGGTKTVTVTDSLGGTITDHPALAGFSREQVVKASPTGAAISGLINDPWVSPRTARRTAGGATVEAYLTGIGSVRTRALRADGQWRSARSTTTYDDTDGLPAQVDEEGDLSTPDDDLCTRTTYARNATTGLLDYPSRVETVSARCAATPVRPADVVSDARTYYDGQAFGVAPTRGLQTKSEELATWSGGPGYLVRSETAYDAYGRPTSEKDALGNPTGTAYTPTTGPVTSVTSTNPAGHASTLTVDPAWGQPTASSDANLKITNLAYDPLGRLIKVWRAGRPTTATPHTEYAYAVQKTGTSVVTTRTLRPNGTYTTAYTLYDGLLRVRQTQSPAPTSGRQITDTTHDSRGLVRSTSAPYYNTAAPTTTVLDVADVDVPSQTVVQYDGARRPVREILYSHGLEKWRTTTTHSGDQVTVDPPTGGTPTTALLDAQGRVTELRQYRGDSPTGQFDATKYAFDHAGRPFTITDAKDAVWKSEYDLLGREIRNTDPDRGVTTTTYDEMDRPVTVTDARGTVLASTYDSLGRRTTLRDGSVTGTIRAEWLYDTVRKGQLTSATRYVDSAAYVQSVSTYDDQYRPTMRKVTIPAAEGLLAKTYSFSRQWNVDGTLAFSSSPAEGGLPAEVVGTSYNELGMPVTVSSSQGYYAIQTIYTKIGQQEAQVYATATSGAPRVQQSLTWDQATGRLTRAVVDREVSPMRVSDTAYGHDQAGNVTSVVDESTGQPKETQCFAYDSLRRLTEAWTPATDCAATRNTASLGGPAPYWHSYGYDATGNRLSETRHASAGDTTSTYAYPAAGAAQPHTVRSVTSSGPGGTQLDSYGYDIVGNTTARTKAGVGQTLTWDAEGHLASVVQGGQTTSYVYDAAGARLLRKDASGTTLYLDGLELRLSGGAVAGTRYYSAGGAPIAVRTMAGVSWLLSDPQGTAQTSITAVGQTVQRRRQTPFGQPRGATPAWPSEQGFVGGAMDATGLTHLGAREYDPGLGRFISVDPLLDTADTQQIQGYSYANNSPVTFSDPDGLICQGFDGIPCQEIESWVEKHEAKKAAAKAGAATVSARPAVVEDSPVVRAARQQVSQAKERVRVAKQRVVRIVRSLATIAMDELGITAGLECLTQGDVGACLETGTTVLATIAGGLVGKLLKKYGAPWKWDDAQRLVSRVWGLVREGSEGVSDWSRARGGLKAAQSSLDEVSCNSFVPGTAVLLASGDRVPIDEVAVGDRVLATDPESGRTEARTVAATIVGTGTKDLVEIGLAGGGTLVATAGHPFWVDDEGRWIDAGDLRPGDHLLTATGFTTTVTKIRHRTEVRRVHNLTITGIHTYYVTTGRTSALTHNCTGPVTLSDAQLDTHVLPRHGPGTPGQGTKFHDSVDPDDYEALANEAVMRSPMPSRVDTRAGTHAHDYDFGPGRSIGADGGSRIRVWVDGNRNVTSMYPN